MALNTKIRHSKSSSRLQQLVNNYGITASALAKESGLHRASVCRYLSGEYTPSDQNAEKLAEVLNVDPAWLQGKDDTKRMNVLTDSYNMLNELGKSRVLEYIEILLDNEKYSFEEENGPLG